MRIVIVGAGAAGCFAAITLKRECPEAEVIVLERGRRALAKVAVTGGGRCNLTNSFRGVKSLEQVYPRGHRLMKRLFYQFSPKDTYRWFEKEGVALVTQEDECVFPRSQQAMEVVNTLLSLMERLGVRLITETRIQRIEPVDGSYRLHTDKDIFQANKVLVTTGGHPKPSGYDLLRGMGLKIYPPVPSLFSFCLDDERLRQLMGTVVENVILRLPGTKVKVSGTLLITHWGVSGPVVLRLSSYIARLLAQSKYYSPLCVYWAGTCNEEEVRQELVALREANPRKLVSSVRPFGLQSRLWEYLLARAEVEPDTRWVCVLGSTMNRLISTIYCTCYYITDKNPFKEEFVTCGGVLLSELNPATLECKHLPGLYLAGEVTDTDAVTGGFNLQAAWTMGYVAARSIIDAIKE